MLFRACISAAVVALLFVLSCSSQPAAQCGTGEGTYTGNVPVSGCTFKWTCDANKPLEMRCVRAADGSFACDCFGDGILEKSFYSLDACDRRRESGKSGCGWDVF